MEENKSKPDSTEKKRRIPFLKHYVPVWAVLLVTLAISAGVYAAVTLTSQKTVTVKEPLTVSPSSQTFSFFAGETVKVDFTIVDLATVSIPTTLTVTCTLDSTAPPTASCSDLALTIEGGATQNMAPGANTILIDVAASSSAVPADYIISLSVTR